VLWWVPAGHVPTVAEGTTKLTELERNGPTPAVFTFKQLFDAPDGTPVFRVLDECT
jgi:hypothetical protein